MLILVTMMEEDKKTGKPVLVVSHGIDEATGRNVCLPGEHPSVLGGVYSEELREWVIEDYTLELVRERERQADLAVSPAPAQAPKVKEEPAVDWFADEYGSPSM